MGLAMEKKMGLDGEESGNNYGRRNDDEEESREVLSGFGPKRREEWWLLSSVGKEDERLERWRARGMIWSAAVGKENGSARSGGGCLGFLCFWLREGAAAALRKKTGLGFFYL